MEMNAPHILQNSLQTSIPILRFNAVSFKMLWRASGDSFSCGIILFSDSKKKSVVLHLRC